MPRRSVDRVRGIESTSSADWHAAGARSPLFSPAALTALYHAASGLPRRLNRIADLALLIAYAQDLAIADESTIAIAAREFNQDGLAA